MYDAPQQQHTYVASQDLAAYGVSKVQRTFEIANPPTAKASFYEEGPKSLQQQHLYYQHQQRGQRSVATVPAPESRRVLLKPNFESSSSAPADSIAHVQRCASSRYKASVGNRKGY